MNQISEYEARLRDQDWDKAEDRRLERKAEFEKWVKEQDSQAQRD